ncbi:hypothetical protein VZC37_05730 [Gordonia sp. LSe1-13]|uniref:Copper chaperone PCu(A)C n=1 Tax=Gordonia sesuvii TaxID=3116777 RepID=A0ABU7M9T0_9ACTN|nr:hypothetical protein [Gordonia sp. LSe1-13]
MRTRSIIPIIGVAALLAACSDDPDGGSSNRGSGYSGTGAGEVSIGNAFITPENIGGRCALQVGGEAGFRYIISNGSETDPVTFTGISTDVAESVQISPAGPKQIEPESEINSGVPGADLAPGDGAFTTTLIGLREDAEPGQSFTVTFTFENSDPVDLIVPVEACPAA